jgi:hypothetical protein
MISDLIHLSDDRKHLFGRHTSRDQGLMRITKDEIRSIGMAVNAVMAAQAQSAK